MRRIAGLLLVVAAFAIPYVVPDAYLYLIGLTYLFAIIVISWDLMVGYTGQVNLGHTTFVGLGAYVAALLQSPLRLDIAIHPALAIFLGGIVAASVGLAVGIITLRLRGYYFSLVTAILPLVFMQTVFIWRDVLGGEEGFSIAGYAMFDTTIAKYYFSLVLLLLSFAIMLKIVKSRIGLRFMALRDSEELAESLGIDTTKYKILAFVISSFFAGVAGAAIVNYRYTVGPELYGVPLMLLIILSAVLGGLGTLYGPMFGGIAIYLAKNWWLGDLIRALSLPINDDIVLYAILIAVGILMPEGIYHEIEKRIKH
ncbi:branched-chain amino acid ABC transporter permease [Archaeoglobus neptunius]|uniref:branched-chain amino acid ABC transporter permease n=1 Tax=Archaeoglobus neptunius TaxID=2798580 RepID=UPI001E50259A|nr:branched-chain amino acid ABC transporter permease [Archaeoglobus neptunius]